MRERTNHHEQTPPLSRCPCPGNRWPSIVTPFVKHIFCLFPCLYCPDHYKLLTGQEIPRLFKPPLVYGGGCKVKREEELPSQRMLPDGVR